MTETAPRGDDSRVSGELHEGQELTAEAAAGGPLRQSSLWGDAWRSLRRNPLFLAGAALSSVLLVMAVSPQLFTRTDPRDLQPSRALDPPSSHAWFGYDVQGQDYFAHVIYGARNSVTIGFVVVLSSIAVGLTVGSLAGYYGGWFDNVVTRLTDIVYGLPQILGSILILTVANQAFGRNVWTVSLALVALGWMTPMRLVRSSVIAVKHSDYVLAARALGARGRRIILRHILPNSMAPVLVFATINVGTIIAAEATLSYLGIGLQLPDISWGLQINSGQGRLRTAPHLVLFPGLFLSVTVLSFIMMGDALRDALDPKNR